MIEAGETLAQILSGMAREWTRGYGPVKWCKRCSRRHPIRSGCRLVSATVPAASGRLVERLVHPPED